MGKNAATKAAESKVEDSSESKEPRLKSLRTEGAASNVYAKNEDLSTFEGSAEQNLERPKWADKMLRIENKLAEIKKQLSREKPPDHVASFVAKRIEDFLANVEFPISDKKIAQMLFNDFGQQPLVSLYHSFVDSCGDGSASVVSPIVGLEIAKLCGLKRSATKFAIDGLLTFEPLNDDLDGPDPFIISLLAGRIDVAKLIIEEDKRNSMFWDAITVSCDAGRRLRSWDSFYKMSPLQLISAFGDPEALRYLLSVKVDNKYNSQWTPLHSAAFYCKLDNMKVLIDEGKYDVNETTSDRPSPLHLTLLSTERQRFDAFSLLLEKGADVNKPDGYGVTPLHLAAEKDDTRFMEALLARDADVKKLDNNQRSLLHIEAQKGNVKAIKALLAHGLEINGLCKYEKKSPLHYALVNKHDAAAEFLITKGAKVTKADAEGRTPLHLAVSNGSAHIVKLLLAKGVGIGAGDSFLVEAAKIGNVEVIEALIVAGASPCTDHKTPPWFVAAYNDKKEVFPILLAHSVASVSDVSLILEKTYSEQLLSCGCSGDVIHGNALHWASRMGDVKSASLLVKMGANVNDTKCTRGQTPLHVAAERNDVALINFLVSTGAEIQAKDSYGWSPLHSAAAADKHEAMAALVELGADLTVKTKSGKTPLESYNSYCYGRPSGGIVALLTPKHDE